MARERTVAIRRALLDEVFWTGRSPVLPVARQFGLSKQAVHGHLTALLESGEIFATGKTRARRYAFRETLHRSRSFKVTPSLSEDTVWEKFYRPLLDDADRAAVDVCYYGVTEMINNAIEHSEGTKLTASLRCTTHSITIRVADDGVGVFQKIARSLSLTDPRQSLLELSKGKFTTDPSNHTGEGIFFTSRAFDRFFLRSTDLLFRHTTRTDDWLIDVKDESFVGTRVTMVLKLPALRTLESVFQQFSSGPEDHRFAKTHVPLELATFGDESLMSRSSARRVLARVDRFDEVLLDFSGIQSVGQAFADEIFRVFANAHPNVMLVPINANEQVTFMIRRAEAARREGPRGA